MEYLKPSIAHLVVYGRVKQNTKGNITDRKNILKVLRWYIRIPGPHQLDFFKEMEETGFFKKISRDKYEVLTKEIKAGKEIEKIMKFIEKLEEPFKQKFINLMEDLGYIKLEEGQYKILRRDVKSPRDFYGNPLWN